MKALLLSLAALIALVPHVSAEKCTGKDPCTACKDCTQCEWCAKKGNSCGTMRDQNGEAQRARDAKRERQKKAGENKK